MQFTPYSALKKFCLCETQMIPVILHPYNYDVSGNATLCYEGTSRERETRLTPECLIHML